MAFKFPSLRDIVVGLIVGFFAIQIISLILSELFPSVPLLKGGNAILLILLCVSIVALFILGMNFDQLKKKETLVFIVILFALIALAYWKLPEFFPQLFSISPEISETIKQVVGSIIGG